MRERIQQGSGKRRAFFFFLHKAEWERKTCSRRRMLLSEGKAVWTWPAWDCVNDFLAHSLPDMLPIAQGFPDWDWWGLLIDGYWQLIDFSAFCWVEKSLAALCHSFNDFLSPCPLHSLWFLLFLLSAVCLHHKEWTGFLIHGIDVQNALFLWVLRFPPIFLKHTGSRLTTLNYP